MEKSRCGREARHGRGEISPLRPGAPGFAPAQSLSRSAGSGQALSAVEGMRNGQTRANLPYFVQDRLHPARAKKKGCALSRSPSR